MDRILMKEYFNALPEHVALDIRNRFLTGSFDRIYQDRESQFKRQFNEKSKTLPDNDEVYTSFFCNSGKFLTSSAEINDVCNNMIKPLVEAYAGKSLTINEKKCYKMTAGGHFRLHIDEFLGDYSFIWYLSKNWKWDWGGLLLTVIDDNNANVTIPTFNKLVAFKNTDSQTVHAVTHVTEYAKEPRLMLVGFLS